MPANKDQHFVPKHYLRQFQIPGKEKQICAARIEPLKLIVPCGIEGQCQEDYFYREDGNLDDLLRESEKDLAPILLRVSEFGIFDRKDLTALQMLAVILHIRTRKNIEHQKLLPRRIADEVIRNAIATGELPPPEGGWKPEMMDFSGVAGGIMKASAIPCWLEMRTLECKVLRAYSGSFFITSDHPVVMLNQLFSAKDNFRSFVGFSRSGFQLLLPISPQFALFFYDPKIYKVGSRRERIVEISIDDVSIANSLQVQNAERCIYFHVPGLAPQIEELILKYSGLRKKSENHLREYPLSDDRHTLLHLKTPSVILPRTWTFCRYRRHRTVGINNRRNPAWTNLIDRLMRDMDENPSGGDIFDRLEKILGAKIKNYVAD